MADYIPTNAALLRDWASNFAARIADQPADYGLSSSDLTTISQAVEAYCSAYALAHSKQTRTPVAVAGKKQTRKQLIQILRPYAQLIRANSAVGESLKIGLKLTLASKTRQRIAKPSSAPMLHVLKVTPGQHLLGRVDTANPDQRRKPANVIGMQLFCHVGQTPPEDPLNARFESFVTRQRHTVNFKPEQAGQRAFYFARWQSATGATGPWSQVVSMTVLG